MNMNKKKLEITQSELDLITNALETQTKILGMQASAGGHGALARLNEVKRVLASLSSTRDCATTPASVDGGLWSFFRSGDAAV